jgi:hypothetical protein
MNLDGNTIRERLQNYEFTDDQELALTLELLNRIENDIDELRAKKTRDGFSEYVVFAGLAAALFLLLGELNKLTEISFPFVAVILFGGLLLLKIPWALYQLLAIDYATRRRHEKGRFFWSNDLWFEDRIAAIFQLIVFVICGVLLFVVPLPLWVAITTGGAFALYVFIIGLISILSFKKEPFSLNNKNNWTMAGLPLLFLAVTIASVIGLILQLEFPVGKKTAPYAVAGLLLTFIFFVDRLIRIQTPSLLLGRLENLRYDIIFLKADLKDAWIRYEVAVSGHDISEELRTEMDDIISSFNMLDYGLAQKEKCVAAVNEEIQRLETQLDNGGLNENDFTILDSHKREFFQHFDAIDRLYADLQRRLIKLAKDINRISRTTQEWERADKYQKYILSRDAALHEKDKRITANAAEADKRIALLPTKKSEETEGDSNEVKQRRNEAPTAGGRKIREAWGRITKIVKGWLSGF